MAGVTIPFIRMNDLAFKVLNGPVSIFNLVAYIFYAFCLFCCQDGADVPKQPLKILLGTLVMFTSVLQINSLLRVFLDFSAMPWYIGNVLNDVQLYCWLCTLSTVVWVNVFYYTQIVPPHSVFSIWLKKNIKSVVYSMIVSDKLFFLVERVLYVVHTTTSLSSSVSSNTTISQELVEPIIVFFFSRVVYIFLGLIVMTASSCATVSYLRRHLRNMKLSRSPITSSLRSQKRVTITGIVQIVLYFLCATWFLLQHLLVFVYPGHFDSNGYIIISVFSLYCFGTALNQGVGQSLFRRRTARLCHKMSEFLNNTSMSPVSM